MEARMRIKKPSKPTMEQAEKFVREALTRTSGRKPSDAKVKAVAKKVAQAIPQALHA